MQFIGVVKTATKQFPMVYLSSMELQDRGERCGLISTDENGKPYLLPFYVNGLGATLQQEAYCKKDLLTFERDGIGKLMKTRSKQIWRWVKFGVPQPKAAEYYYICCAKIDQCNRNWQDTM